MGITGLMSYSFLKVRPVKQVELLRPRDRRGKTLTVARETDLGLECKKTANFIYRFIKAGPSWVFTKSGKSITKFFAIEGTAYTARPKGDEMEVVPVSTWLRFLWGDKFYDAIPPKQKRAVETDVVGITVEIAPIDEEEYDLKRISAADLDDEGDSTVLSKIAKTQKPSTKRDIYQFMVGAAMSAAIIFFMLVKGWL